MVEEELVQNLWPHYAGIHHSARYQLLWIPQMADFTNGPDLCTCWELAKYTHLGLPWHQVRCKHEWSFKRCGTHVMIPVGTRIACFRFWHTLHTDICPSSHASLYTKKRSHEDALPPALEASETTAVGGEDGDGISQW